MTALKIRPTLSNTLGQLQNRFCTPTIQQQRKVFQANISEFMLLTRLRVKNRHNPSAEVLERAVLMTHITCKDWFNGPEKPLIKPASNTGTQSLAKLRR